MRTIIAGSRHATREQTFAVIESCPWKDEITVVLSGMQRGADTWGIAWAKSKGIPFEPYPAEWKRYGLAAGPIRNGIMAQRADALIAALSSDGTGTPDMIEKAEARGLLKHVQNI